VFELRALHAEIERLRLGGLQLRLRLRDIGVGGDAAGVAVLRQIERFAVGLERVVEKLAFLIETA
jgi:hypothetical protein